MSDLNVADLEAAIQRALQPILVELRALRAVIEPQGGPATALGPASATGPATVTSGPATADMYAATESEGLDASASPEQVVPSVIAASVPTDRSDFARMLQRGLEQEAVEHLNEPAAPAKKRGWNPFKR